MIVLIVNLNLLNFSNLWSDSSNNVHHHAFFAGLNYF